MGKHTGDVVPKHIAVVMDGNGRWAKQQGKLRVAGHKAGVEALRTTVEACAQRAVSVLTVFAFGQENWARPSAEITALMNLFMTGLKNEVPRLHQNQIRLRFIGERSALSEKLQKSMADAEALTATNTGLIFVVAINYSGRWDIVQATRRAAAVEDMTDIDEATFASYLSLSDLPEPDLWIRTSGEQRLSNFLLWQCAYSELYFAPCYWPDFDSIQLDQAIAFFQSRERRFGQTSEQLQEARHA